MKNFIKSNSKTILTISFLLILNIFIATFLILSLNNEHKISMDFNNNEMEKLLSNTSDVNNNVNEEESNKVLQTEESNDVNNSIKNNNQNSNTKNDITSDNNSNNVDNPTDNSSNDSSKNINSNTNNNINSSSNNSNSSSSSNSTSTNSNNTEANVNTKNIESKTNILDADTVVLDYLNAEYTNISNYSNTETFKDKAKNTIVTIVDFIFYNGKIKGYTFDQLSTKAKASVISMALKIDDKIDNIIPNYKTSLSNTYKNVKSKLLALYLDITSSVCSAVNEKLDYNLCNDLKSSFQSMKKYLSISWDLITQAFYYGTGKLDEWYQVWKG